MFETLRNFAEIGIAIAGFSAIAATLRSRVSGPWAEADRLALLSLLETSALWCSSRSFPRYSSRS